MSLLLEMFTYPFIVRAFVVGILVSLCAALLGVPLVLKRYSMIGDGLSHVSFGALSIAVACGFNAEGGTRNFDFSTRATHSPLHEYLTVGRTAYPRDGFFLRAESFYNVATNIDEMDEEPGPGGRVIDSYGGVSLHRQSHGESFLSLVHNRFWGQGIYLLDEPEAALSPSRQMYMLCRIKQLVESGSQFIVSTHSPIVMAYPGADIYEIADNGLQLTELEQTPHYLLMKRFCLDHEGMLRQLGFGIPES